MPTAPARLTFVSSLFTSKIFWTQIVALTAMVLSAAGYHIIDAPGVQEQVVGYIDVAVTIILRLYSSGPVSLSGPVSVPPDRDIHAGVSVVTVVSPQEQERTAAQAVQQIGTGVHQVTVAAPVVPGTSAPASVAVARVQ